MKGLIIRSRSLPAEGRKKYIVATNCMMTKPAKFRAQFPIIESRYDDFKALHVNISLSGTGFLRRKYAGGVE
jgi:hypothetical protein